MFVDELKREMPEFKKHITRLTLDGPEEEPSSSSEQQVGGANNYVCDKCCVHVAFSRAQTWHMIEKNNCNSLSFC